MDFPPRSGLDMWMDNLYQREKTKEDLQKRLDTYGYENDFGIPEPKPSVPDCIMDDSCSYTLEEYEQYIENLSFNTSLVPAPGPLIGRLNTPQPAKKIKPIKIPGLVLKTPIAYEKDTDLNVIPIKKEGMGVCEQCGAIGVKHAFYTKLRRFCSQMCARNFNESLKPILPMEPNVTITEPECLVAEDPLEGFGDEVAGPALAPGPGPGPAASPGSVGFQWLDFLGDPEFLAAPVTCFKHAPAVAVWKDINIGMKVEVENTDCDDYSPSQLVPSDSFWVSSVLQVSGYWGRLRYLGFADTDHKDFWVNLCSNVVKPVGWCAMRGKPLIPPKSIEYKYTDWKTFLSSNLHGAQTLPSNFLTRVQASLESRFALDMVIEVVDKNHISQVKVATIAEIVGKRLRVRYYDSEPEDLGFTCHEDSPLLHPVGWAHSVGARLDAPADYLKRCSRGQWRPNDATNQFFPHRDFSAVKMEGLLSAGMKLEAIDPLNLSSICVATIMKVLRNNYVMIRIDSYDEDVSNSDWFCYHTSSPCIFPAGFCNVNHIPLTPPKGCSPETFVWAEYLEQSGLTTAPLTIFHREIPRHGFTVGMRLEAADLMDPRLVCVGTVARVVGRLLRVHFDGWEDEYDQWLDCESPDIYPVGWCDVVHHKLQAPRSPHQVKVGRGLKRKFGRRPRRWHRAGAGAAAAVGGAGKSESAPQPVPQGGPAAPLSVTPAPEPEMGQEPAGPDQALPDAPVENPPPRERPATSYINGNGSSGKAIPRLVDASGAGRGELVPAEWNVFDVAQFLRVNDCATYCDSFSKRKIDGKTLINLSKDQIIDLTGMKVGPSLKIFDLIQQLKIKVNPSVERQKAFKKLAS